MRNLLLLIFLSAYSAHGLELSLKNDAWVTLSFNNIPANQVVFNDDGIKVRVRDSAGPLVHKLPQPLKLTGFRLSGVLKGSKTVERGAFDEDSVLRVGLVAVGDKTLNAVKRMFAADWVKKLFALAPANTGLDKIHFFNLTDRPEMMNQMRTHPKSELLFEKIVQKVNKEGPFTMEVTLDRPIETAALWLSIDGDDSKSKFEMLLSKIEILEPTKDAK